MARMEIKTIKIGNTIISFCDFAIKNEKVLKDGKKSD